MNLLEMHIISGVVSIISLCIKYVNSEQRPNRKVWNTVNPIWNVSLYNDITQLELDSQRTDISL